MKLLTLIFFSTLFLVACGEDKATTSSTNQLYKKEIETLDQAKQLQQQMNQQAKQTQQRMDELNKQ